MPRFPAAAARTTPAAVAAPVRMAFHNPAQLPLASNTQEDMDVRLPFVWRHGGHHLRPGREKRRSNPKNSCRDMIRIVRNEGQGGPYRLA